MTLQPHHEIQTTNPHPTAAEDPQWPPWSPAPVARRTDDTFFVTMSFLILAGILFGFAQSYFLRGAVFAHLPSLLVHIHGAAFSSWIILFVVQTLLVAKRNIRLHRTLGTFGGFLAAAMVILGWAATLAVIRRGVTPPGLTAPMFIVLNCLGITVFGTLVGWAILVRNQPAQHKRLMLLGTLGLMGPAISRWPIPLIQNNPQAVTPFFFAYVLSVLAYDLITRHKPYRVTVIATIIVLAVFPIANAVGSTPFMHRVVANLQHNTSTP